MFEISLHILDILQNSIKAGAMLITVSLTLNGNTLTVVIEDNGCGMSKEFVAKVCDPFVTTRTTRKVGLGIPLFMLASQQTGGNLTIDSRHESEYPDSHGTEVCAVFYKNHLDFTPLGDIVSTITVLIQGQPQIRWIFEHKTENGDISLDTDMLKEVLGDVPLDTFEVIVWIGEYLKEQYSESGYKY